MWAVLAVALVVGGCFAKPDAPLTDGGGGSEDGDPIGSGCQWGAWSASNLAADLSTLGVNDSDDPALYGDVLVFSSTRFAGTDHDLYTAVVHPNGFGEPQRIPAAATTFDEKRAAWAADGTELYLSHGVQSRNLKSHRVGVTEFDTPVETLEFDSLGQIVLRPRFSADGSEVVYHSDFTSDIYRSVRGSNGTFPAGSSIAEINSTADDRSPTISADGQTICFSSSRNSTALSQLFCAERIAPGATYAAPKLASIDTASVGQAPELSADGRTLLFVRNEMGGPHIRVSMRACQ